LQIDGETRVLEEVRVERELAAWAPAPHLPRHAKGIGLFVEVGQSPVDPIEAKEQREAQQRAENPALRAFVVALHREVRTDRCRPPTRGGAFLPGCPPARRARAARRRRPRTIRAWP